MMWAFQSFFGMFLDAMVGQVVHALGAAPPGGRPASPPHPPAPAALEAPPFVSTVEAAPQDTGLGGEDVKLVEYSIVSVRPCCERVLPGGAGEVMVRGSMTREGFTAWIIAHYPHRHEIPPDDKRYLRVHHSVLTRWPCERPGQGRRIAVLKGIRDAINDLPGEEAP